MRTWIVSATVFLVLIATLVWLTTPDEIDIEIHGIRKNHAFFHSNEKKTFELGFVLNAENTRFGLEEAMTGHRLVTEPEGTAGIALEFHGASVQTLENDAVLVKAVYAMPFSAGREHVHIDPALLRISYDDGTVATVPIGTFSYRFHEGANIAPHLDYTKITVLSESSALGASASGACIAFNATSEEPVTITGIDPGTPALQGNMDYLTPHEGNVTPLTSVEAITGGPFNPKAVSVNPLTATLEGGQKKTLCVPFHRKNLLVSDSFPFVITYETEARSHTLIIEDFKYIRNTSFHTLEAKEASRGVLEKD